MDYQLESFNSEDLFNPKQEEGISDFSYINIHECMNLQISKDIKEGNEKSKCKNDLCLIILQLPFNLDCFNLISLPLDNEDSEIIQIKGNQESLKNEEKVLKLVFNSKDKPKNFTFTNNIDKLDILEEIDTISYISGKDNILYIQYIKESLTIDAYNQLKNSYSLFNLLSEEENSEIEQECNYKFKEIKDKDKKSLMKNLVFDFDETTCEEKKPFTQTFKNDEKLYSNINVNAQRNYNNYYQKHNSNKYYRGNYNKFSIPPQMPQGLFTMSPVPASFLYPGMKYGASFFPMNEKNFKSNNIKDKNNNENYRTEIEKQRANEAINLENMQNLSSFPYLYPYIQTSSNKENINILNYLDTNFKKKPQDDSSSSTSQKTNSSKNQSDSEENKKEKEIEKESENHVKDKKQQKIIFHTNSTRDYQFKYVSRYIVQIENEKNFPVTKMLIGNNGILLRNIILENCIKRGDHSTKIRLRGRGSGHKEGANREESKDPMELCISSLNFISFVKCSSAIELMLLKIYYQYYVYQCQQINEKKNLNGNLEGQSANVTYPAMKKILKYQYIVNRFNTLAKEEKKRRIEEQNKIQSVNVEKN